MQTLDPTEAAAGLAGWRVDDGDRPAIARSLRFADFNAAFGFMALAWCYGLSVAGVAGQCCIGLVNFGFAGARAVVIPRGELAATKSTRQALDLKNGPHLHS